MGRDSNELRQRDLVLKVKLRTREKKKEGNKVSIFRVGPDTIIAVVVVVVVAGYLRVELMHRRLATRSCAYERRSASYDMQIPSYNCWCHANRLDNAAATTTTSTTMTMLRHGIISVLRQKKKKNWIPGNTR